MSDEPPIIRDPAGRFLPGTRANPGGRPQMPDDIREALEAGAPAAVARLVQLVGSDDDRVALAASEALLSRLYGKPSQTLDAKVETTNIQQEHLRILQEIAARREARRQDAETIEG